MRAEDVEIGQAGLDHDHVGALGDVELGLAQRLVGIAVVHLVGALVAGECRRGADGIAERAVERRGVFRRIGHDLHVDVSRRRRAPARIAPTRPSIMSDGAMMSQPASACTSACLHQHGDGLVVEDGAVAHQAVVAVAGVGIERHVAQHADLRHRLLDGADRLADQIVGVERLAAVARRAGSGRCRETARCRGWSAAAARSASRTTSSTVSRSTPGIEATGARRPSATNSGQIRSLVVSTFSRTMRRAHSVRRLRRRRVVRSSDGAGSVRPSAGTTRTRDSIGRPYLIAMIAGSSMRTCFILSGPHLPAAPPAAEMGMMRCSFALTEISMPLAGSTRHAIVIACAAHNLGCAGAG